MESKLLLLLAAGVTPRSRRTAGGCGTSRPRFRMRVPKQGDQPETGVMVLADAPPK